MAFAVNKIGLEKPYISFSSLSYYNSFKAFGLGPDRVLDKNKFWSIYRKDDSGSYQVPIVLTKAAEDNVVVTWSFSGSAVDGTHYTCPISSITIRPGTLIGYIPIEIIDRGKWFKEKDLIITLNAPSNTILAKDQDKVRIVFVPSTAPPEITVSTTLTGDFGSTNLYDPETEWTVGTGGVGTWEAYGITSENIRAVDTNPHGDQKVIWKAVNVESGATYDGGFMNDITTYDPSNNYRISVWFNSKSAHDGRLLVNNVGAPIYNIVNSSTLVNIIFKEFADFNVDEWYLFVLYINPYTYTGSGLGLDGVYNTSGTKVFDTNTNMRFVDAAHTGYSPRFAAYNDPSDGNEEVWFWDPRFDLVDGTEPSLADLLNPPTEMIRNVHADENLWQWSNDLVAGGSETGEDTPIALYPVEMDLPRFPGIPTPAIYDGTKHTGDSWGQGGGRPQAQIWEQDATSPVLDPVTGNPLKIYGPDQYAEGMPYVRESFSKVFCGGPLTAHQSRRFMRMSFVIEYMQGVDAGRNMEFHRVGIRIREANRNHGAVFRSSVNMPDPLNDARIGKDRYGNSVPVYGPFDGVKFWLWQYGYSMAPQDCGVVADENGHPRLWYWVQMDPNIVYPGPSFTNVPDDVGIFCNPIEYPQWFATNDGTNIRADGATDRTLTIDQIRAQRLGALWHSMMFEMSDTTYNGGPARFWPKMSHNGWAPLGNASLEDAPQYDTSISFVLEA